MEERAVEDEIAENYSSTSSSELEEIASTIALTADIYIDAKTGVFDVGKLTELLAKQPQVSNLGSGGSVGRTPAGEEKEQHNKKMEDGLKQLIEMAKKQQTVSGGLCSITDAVTASPNIHQRNHDKTATREYLDEVNKEIVLKNKTIADMLDRDRRMRESNLTNYKSTTRYMMKVGKPTYKDYCKTTLKNMSDVNASEHLRQFRVDMRECMDDLMVVLSETIDLQRPKSDSAWRTMQASVLQELNIIITC